MPKNILQDAEITDIKAENVDQNGRLTVTESKTTENTSRIVVLESTQLIDIEDTDPNLMEFNASGIVSGGGNLEDAGNVWTGNDKIYLKSQQDVVGSKFADIESPYYRWSEQRTPEQLDSLFSYNFNISHLGDVVQDTMDIPFTIQVNERYSSGRIKNMDCTKVWQSTEGWGWSQPIRDGDYTVDKAGNPC